MTNPANTIGNSIGYRTYPPGTKATSYSTAELGAASDELTRVQHELSEPNRVSGALAGIIPAQSRILEPQATLESTAVGPAAIRELSVIIKPEDPGIWRRRYVPRSSQSNAMGNARCGRRWVIFSAAA